MSYAIIVMGAVAATTAIVQQVGANSARKDELEYMKTRSAQLNRLKDARQAIPDIGRHYKDLSKDLSNPFANMAVATQAAEMQAEEADISLANTLDTLMATGTSAGGATALAQAALRSKQGISATIESQEVANEKLRAGGEQSLQMAKMQEQQRLQSARAGAEQWGFGARETREMADINRAAGMLDQSRAQAAEYGRQAAASAAQTTQAFGQMAGAVAGNQKSGGQTTSDPLEGQTTTDIFAGMTQEQRDMLYQNQQLMGYGSGVTL